MKNTDLAKRMARQTGVTAAEAADQLGGLVRDVLADLRQGGESTLPGLGRFRYNSEGKVVFEAERGGARG